MSSSSSSKAASVTSQDGGLCRRRQRNNIACAYCRYRKIKCNGAETCDNCIRTGRVCVYNAVSEAENRAARERKAASKAAKAAALRAGSPSQQQPPPHPFPAAYFAAQAQQPVHSPSSSIYPTYFDPNHGLQPIGAAYDDELEVGASWETYGLLTAQRAAAPLPPPPPVEQVVFPSVLRGSSFVPSPHELPRIRRPPPPIHSPLPVAGWSAPVSPVPSPSISSPPRSSLALAFGGGSDVYSSPPMTPLSAQSSMPRLMRHATAPADYGYFPTPPMEHDPARTSYVTTPVSSTDWNAALGLSFPEGEIDSPLFPSVPDVWTSIYAS